MTTNLRLVAIAFGMIGVVVVAGRPAIHVFHELYPADPLKREMLNACASYDLTFNRADPAERARCYRDLPRVIPGEAHARVGVMANQLDLRKDAGRGSRAGNDIRIIQETEIVHGGISR